MPALAGVKVMSLVMATLRSVAGIRNRLPPWASGSTLRAGTETVLSCSSWAISSASADQGRRCAVAAASSVPAAGVEGAKDMA